MNEITVHPETVLGYDFIPKRCLRKHEDEYRLRTVQLGKDTASFRPLNHFDVEILIKNENRCADWSKIFVRDPFDANLIRNSQFAGLVRIGSLQRTVLEHHDMRIPTGITSSRIISCDIGDDCAIHACRYIAHYILGERCILLNNDEVHVSPHAKWGNGIIKEGEDESVRIWLDVMNEAGGRSVLPFDGMICADAWLWAKRRGDGKLMERFKELTEARFEKRQGEYGVIGSGCVLKSNHIIKDVKIGDCAYIKGANKLKNLTINSSDSERTQIGEGVELVNGIVGYGCRVFYGCKAVRFVMGTNSALKYGARLIHSVLGDNSTVSCCEILNNLIFPAHEQHHNTSFLIAALVRGQSNMAAGATIGSNHNSRANDGEIDAGRGFWPGLSTSVKHNSRFASYCLLAKGHYRYELDIPFPFALVADNAAADQLEIMPAYWWMYNMYALMRNEAKFLSRDKRIHKIQNVEFSPFAPDIIEEIFTALAALEEYTGRSWYSCNARGEVPDTETLRARGKELLLGRKEDIDALIVYGFNIENSQRAIVIQKPRRAYKAYRHIVRWYALMVIIEYCEARADMSLDDIADVLAGPRVQVWDNLGGQLVPAEKTQALISAIKSKHTGSWDDVHAEYARLWGEYPVDKAQHAWASLCALLDMPKLSAVSIAKELSFFKETTRFIEEQVFITRQKDFSNKFRKITFADAAEMRAVLGSAENNSFVKQSKAEMKSWRAKADHLAERFRL